MKRLFTVILLLFCLTEVKGQILWEHDWKTSPDSLIRNQKVIISKKGEIFVVGECLFIDRLADYPSIYLLKYDLNGNRIFTYGGLYTDVRNGYCLTEARNGDIIVAGDYIINNSGLATYLERISANGFSKWRKAISTPYSMTPTEIISNDDGGFIIVGAKSIRFGVPDYGILKVDSIGNSVWFKYYGYWGGDYVCSVVKDGKGKYVLSGFSQGTSYSSVNTKNFLLRIDENGDSLAGKFLTVRYPGFDERQYWYQHNLVKTTDGGYIFTGFLDSTDVNGVYNIPGFVAKTDSAFNIQWNYSSDILQLARLKSERCKN